MQSLFYGIIQVLGAINMKRLKTLLLIFSIIIISGCDMSNTTSYSSSEQAYRDSLIAEITAAESSNSALISELTDHGYDINDGYAQILHDIEVQNALLDTINTDILMGNVLIANQEFFFHHEVSESIGSGFVIAESADKYYILTNNHVVYNYSTLYLTELNVMDYQNNVSTAEIVFVNANYDMALLSIDKTNPLKVLSLADKNPTIDTRVISIGQPYGQRDGITFGKVLSYQAISCSNCEANESNIKYSMCVHDSWIAPGSSGGMLLDYNLKIVGINTLGSYSDDEFLCAMASPLAKIKEFMAQTGIIV